MTFINEIIVQPNASNRQNPLLIFLKSCTMKKLSMAIIALITLTVISNKALAQYPIPSFNVPIVADPTTFTEVTSSSAYSQSPINISRSLFVSKSLTRGEKKVNITARDGDIQTTASATVNIYANENRSITYGPYTVIEGSPFSKTLSDQYTWSVQVVGCSEGCELDVWYD